jgi:hypothetical protein
MNTPQFADSGQLWDVDGSLRDVYILGTTQQSWEQFLAFATRFPCTYLFDGHARQLPSIVEIFSNRSGSHILSIKVGEVTLNCHFFVVSEIELDINPKDVLGQSEHLQVLRFIEGAASALSKPALLTPENSEDTPFLTYDPLVAKWTAHE